MMNVSSLKIILCTLTASILFGCGIDLDVIFLEPANEITFTPSQKAQSLPEDMGECAPLNSKVSVMASPANSMVPNTAECTCNDDGKIDCSTNEVTIQGTDFLLDFILSNGTRTTTANQQIANVKATLNLDPLTGPFLPGASINIEGTCFVPESEVIVTLPSQLESTPPTTKFYCQCQNDGTFSLDNGDCSSEPKQAGTLITNLTATAVDETVTIGTQLVDPDGDISEVTPISTDILSTLPTIDIVSPTTISPNPVAQALPSNMGTCSINGTGNVLLSATPTTSMTPSTATCDCTSGVVNCSGTSVIVNGSDFSLSAQLNLSASTVTDPTPVAVDVPAALSLTAYGSPILKDNPIPIGGTCSVPDSEITINLPLGVTASPSVTNFYCICQSDGTYNLSDGDCDDTSGVGGTQIASVTASTLTTGLNITASLIDPDGDSAGPFTETFKVDGLNCSGETLASGNFEEGVALPSTSVSPTAGSITIPIFNNEAQTVIFSLNQNGFKVGSAAGSGTYSIALSSGATSVTLPLSYDGTNLPISSGITGTVDLTITADTLSGSCTGVANILKTSLQLTGRYGGQYSEDGDMGICMMGASKKVYCWSSRSTFHNKTPANPGLRYDMSASVAGLFPATSIQGLAGISETGSFAITADEKLVSWGQYNDTNRQSLAQNLSSGGSTILYGDMDYVSQNALEGWDFTNRKVKQVAADHGEGCAVLDNNNLWCWGSNGKDVGLGPVINTSSSKTPLPAYRDNGAGGSVTVTDAVSVWVAGSVSCYINTGGDLFCAGDNVYGELGSGTLGVSSNIYKQVTLPQAASAVAFKGLNITYSTCALLTNGEVWCFGRDMNLGSDTATPVQMKIQDTGTPNLTDVIKIVAGGTFICALRDHSIATAATSVYCWGENFRKQLGSPAWAEDAYRTKAVTGFSEPATWLDLGEDHACAVVPDTPNNWRNVFCWGYEENGRIGNGDTGTSNTYAALFGDTGSGAFAAFQNTLDPIEIVTVYSEDTCVITQSGQVYCAGSNSGNNPQTRIMDFPND